MTLPLPDSAVRHCRECGYDLRGSPDGRCPECGTAFDRSIGEPRTPWLRADAWKISGRRAGTFWRTIVLATLHPRCIVDDIYQPANLPAARAFHRALSLRIAVWPVLLLGLLYAQSLSFTRPKHSGYYQTLTDSWWRTQPVLSNHWSWYLEFAWVALVLAAVWFWIHASLGVHTYFCHPRRLSREAGDRAVALAYYAVAPLAWLPLAALAGALIAYGFGCPADLYAARLVLFWKSKREGMWDFVPPWQLDRAQIAAALAPVGFVLLLTIRSAAVIVRRVTFSGLGRPIATVLVTAVAWPVLFLVFPVAIGAAAALIEIILFSLVG